MSKVKFLYILISSLILASCSSMKISMDYDANASFVNLKTYNWLPGHPKKSGNPVIDSDELMHRRIKNEINHWLQQHGYVLAPRNRADFLISYFVVTEQQTRITVLNDYYGYPRGWGFYGGYYGYPGGSRAYVYDYELGTMIIDIVNTRTHKLMWRGTAEDEIKNLKSPEEKKAKIAEVVEKIMTQFPPSR